MSSTWMVRAGQGGRFFDDFKERSIVAIGWRAVRDLSKLHTRDEIAKAVRDAYPDFRDQAVTMTAGQLYRFAIEFAERDRVVTYDPRARVYLCGEIAGPYLFWPNEESEEFLNQRAVAWTHEKPRDQLSAVARNSLGAISTIFSIPQRVSDELWGHATIADPPQTVNEAGEVPVESTILPAPVLNGEDVHTLANEAIKDRIAELSWQDMQELVAGLLRAMGYKTIVSPPGAGRGKDIVASPDGFGFQEPRIVVEVKHRIGERIGSQQIRSFLGGRHPKDKGLYVSTGGFSKDAYYEAERATIQVTLLDFEGLVEAILDRYPSFDEETRQILPLRRVYWPLGK